MAVTQVGTLPAAPQRQDEPSLFIQKSDAWVADLQRWTDDVNLLGSEVDVLATQAEVDALSASNSATSASNSATVSQAAANLVGNWDDQTGALNTPASVAHEGSFWALLNDLADVTTSEPGVTSDWQEVKTTFDWGSPVTASETIVLGDGYQVDVTAGDVTLTYGTTLTVGQRNKFSCFDSVNQGSGNRLFIAPGTQTLFKSDGSTEIAAGGDNTLALSVGDSTEMVVFTTVKVKVV